MNKTAKTAGAGGAAFGGYELYSQSLERWTHPLPMVTMFGYAAAIVFGIALFALWRRVKKLEGKR
jgi:hypothetical protein